MVVFRLLGDSTSTHYTVFIRKGNLTQHTQRVHGLSANRFVCPLPECTASYLRKADLTAHIKAKHPIASVGFQVSCHTNTNILFSVIEVAWTVMEDKTPMRDGTPTRDETPTRDGMLRVIKPRYRYRVDSGRTQ